MSEEEKLRKALRSVIREYLDFVEYERGDVDPLTDGQFYEALKMYEKEYEIKIK